jgi:amidase
VSERAGTVDAVRRALAAREVSAVDLAHDAIARLEAVRVELGAVAALDPERSLAEAARADDHIARGTEGALEGVPIAVKDWIDVAGWPVAGSSAEHRDRRAKRDATAVARMRAAGAVVVGITTALDDSPAHGPTRNPRDPERAAGGSSTGSAVTVATGAVPLALGSDSGGSIRLPAAWCGVYGLRPTFGRVPLTGHFPRLGARSDARTVIGPLANCVDDLTLALALIAGPDGLDAGVVPLPLADPVAVDVTRVRVGLVAGVTDAHVERAASALRAAGVTVVDDAVPDVRDEALEITRRYWQRWKQPPLTGPEFEALLDDWDRFERKMLVATAETDALLMPATTEVAPLWRESVDTDFVWQLPWSLTGSPAIVMPYGSDGELPLSIQIVSQPWNDHVVLAVARSLDVTSRVEVRRGRAGSASPSSDS